MDTFNPRRKDFEPYGFSCVRWEASLTARPDRHNEIEINLISKGELTYLFGDHKNIVPNHRLVIFWAGTPHQVIDNQVLKEYYVMTIPLIGFLHLKLTFFFVQKLLQRSFIVDSNSSEYVAYENDRQELKNICLLEVEARLSRFVLKLESIENRSKIDSPVLGKGDSNNVEQMAVFSAQHFTEPLITEDIASLVGLHPNYAMRLFRNTFGKTLIDFITEFRLSHAPRLLIPSDDLIIDIALSSGFGFQSRFNSVFKNP